LRTVAALTRTEASLLFRSALVLAGFVAGGVLAWDVIHRGEPMWWNAAWQIGYGQMVLSMGVLAAAQLAVGRVQRDDMSDLYDSFPVSPATRTVAQLFGLMGAMPACLILLGASAAFLELRGSLIGTPDLGDLLGGVMLVIAGGAIGVAIGRRFPHPLAGVLGALAWFVPFSQANRFSGGVTWLYPWVLAGQLGRLPGSVAGYPPAVAHVVELAGIATLAGVAAIALSTRATTRRVGLIAAGAVAVAVICVAGALQLQPISSANLNYLVAEVATPAAVQRCTTTNGVRYCLYPGFDTIRSSLQNPVNGVLALLPDRPATVLTIAQSVELSIDDPSLTHGHSKQQVAAWNAQLQNAPASSPLRPATTAAVYVTVGAWPTAAALADARFDVALGAAEWAVGLPTSTVNDTRNPQCVPLDQAREAVAIWLAVIATHTSPGRLQSGVLGTGRRTGAPVGGTIVATWTYPGESAPYLFSPGPQTTAAGALLAEAMTSLPIQKVTDVLDAGWATWSDWHTTNAQLAAALGIPTPTVASFVDPRTGQPLSPPPVANVPSQPVCTS
jgi:hypothetical protein